MLGMSVQFLYADAAVLWFGLCTAANTKITLPCFTLQGYAIEPQLYFNRHEIRCAAAT